MPIIDSALDFDVERRMILDTLTRNEIGCDIRFDNATSVKLEEIMDHHPKIIHISCHGAYDDRTKDFSLLFEHEEKVGVLDLVGVERLKSLLQKTGAKFDGILFVSACFSGAIGQMFHEIGFPCVICVHN